MSVGCLWCHGKDPPAGAKCKHCGRKGGPAPEHRCHAAFCKAGCPPERLMCLRHWRMVPRDLQLAVWAAYRPGQCDDKRPSRAWHRAADLAIAAVAEKEGHPETAAFHRREAIALDD